MTLIHKHIFENTWDWAGKFRRTEKNIGIEPYQVQTQLTILCDDGKFSWGGSSIDVEGKTRLDYLAALRQADKGVYAPLIDFAKRSYFWQRLDVTELGRPN